MASCNLEGLEDYKCCVVDPNSKDSDCTSSSFEINYNSGKNHINRFRIGPEDDPKFLFFKSGIKKGEEIIYIADHSMVSEDCAEESAIISIRDKVLSSLTKIGVFEGQEVYLLQQQWYDLMVWNGHIVTRSPSDKSKYFFACEKSS